MVETNDWQIKKLCVKRYYLKYLFRECGRILPFEINYSVRFYKLLLDKNLSCTKDALSDILNSLQEVEV